MATATQSVPNYCTLITRSRLMSPEQVKSAYQIWQDSTGGSETDTESLRRFLVSKRHLTDYQSHLLMRGHTEGYFLDDYKILEMIGKGRMAGVYKAMHESGQVVAIKVLSPSKAKDVTLLSRFNREGKLLTRLDHPNVVRAYQVGESGGKHYVVLEYFESEPLDEVLERRKRLAPPEAVRVVYQVLLGLQHVFEKGMVHRDLRPSNLALTPPPAQGPNETTLLSTIKILDLGLGRTTFDEATGASDPETQLTTEGSLLGNPDYMAPEQARSAHEADIRADIYSLGCILYQLMTGQIPFPDKNVLTQIVKHATETPPPLSQFIPQTPDGLQQALNWMMAKDPNERYPTPARAAEALKPFLPQQADPKSATGPLPAYLQHLYSSGHIEAPKAVGSAPAGAAVPVGRLETDEKKRERKKDGTGPKPKLAAAGTAVAPSAAVPQYTTIDEYDVEVVSVPPPPPVAPPKSPLPEERSLFDLDRRDYIMVCAGAGIVAFALLIGFGLFRLIRKPPSPTTVEETSQPKEPILSQPYRPREKKVEETRTEEPKTEAPMEEKKNEPKLEDKEAKKDDPKPEDAKKEEMKKDDAKKEEMKKEEMKKEETKKEAAK